jgi:hypothetical protein
VGCIDFLLVFVFLEYVCLLYGWVIVIVVVAFVGLVVVERIMIVGYLLMD